MKTELKHEKLFKLTFNKKKLKSQQGGIVRLCLTSSRTFTNLNNNNTECLGEFGETTFSYGCSWNKLIQMFWKQFARHYKN